MTRIIPVLVLIAICGCAEGPLWQSGSYMPWVKERWRAEEEIADTYFERTRNIDQMVEATANASAEQQNEVARQLKDLIQNEPVLLVRLHAVKSLGRIRSAESVTALALAAKDPDSRIRTAAVKSLKTQSTDLALPHLADIVGSDTNIDVRIEATKALGDLGAPSAIDALSLALVDSNPAIQYRATESLEKLTGQSLGPDVSAWQSYLNRATQSTAFNSNNDSIR